MQIYDDKKKRIGTLTGFKNRSIEKTLDSGDKELSFEYPANGAMVDLLKEEYYIRTKEDEFVIKAVEAGEQYNKYTAVLNVEELEGQSFPYGFASEEQTIRACLEFAFEGTGWTVGTCTVTKKRTIDIEEATTAWGVLQSCLSTYRCECGIDTLQKKINIYTQIGRDRGCYFMEGLNLRKLTATSDTYEFYTRIIPIGKDGITIEWLHGKEYLENYQYSTKVKTYTWKDERYTNTTSLMEDAEAKLEELSKPYKVYAADVVDLAKANPEYKDILDYGIGDTVMMVSKHPRMREKQRIVKIMEYPETPERNTVELSNTTKTFAEVQKAETELAKTEAISIANSTTKKVLQNYSTTEEVETKITASQEKVELGVKHTLESYYDKTETEELIKILKGSIELSVSEIYQTKDAMGEYSTTEEMNAAITVVADAISLKVSKGEVSSQLSVESGEISIKSDRFSWESTNSSLTQDGKLTAKDVDLIGKITAENGEIGGFSISSDTLTAGNVSSTGGGIKLSTSSLKIGGSSNYFEATKDGRINIVGISSSIKFGNSESAMILDADGISFGSSFINNNVNITKDRISFENTYIDKDTVHCGKSSSSASYYYTDISGDEITLHGSSRSDYLKIGSASATWTSSSGTYYLKDSSGDGLVAISHGKLTLSPDSLTLGKSSGKIGFFGGGKSSAKKTISKISSTSNATMSTIAAKVNDIITALQAYNLVG